MTVTLDKSGLNAIQRNFDRKAAGVVQKLATDYAGHVKNNMSTQSPSSPGSPPGVDTGNLKASIMAEPANNPLVWDAYTNVDYAPMLEFGTRRMAARPFFRPAVAWIEQNIPDGVLLEVVRY